MVAIDRLVVIGVGLIGGSFARALKARGKVRHVVGVGRNRANLDAARALGLIDSIEPLPEAVHGADFVLLATPVGQMETAFQRMLPALDGHCVLTDGGSTKSDVIRAARKALGSRFAQFVPGHPIAGGEQSGATASSATLFEQRRVILTPEPETDRSAVARVRAAWEACGAEVVELSAAEHDATLGIVSHLPHVLAYALMHQVIASPRSSTLFDNAGAGFRDFTRLASSHPEMWRDILIANRDAVLAGLRDFDASLAHLRAAIETGDAAALERMLAACRTTRDAWLALEAPVEPAE